MANKRPPSPLRLDLVLTPELPGPGDRDPINPKTLVSLCAALEITLDELNLSCIFCKGDLTLDELESFTKRHFRVIWRSGFPYGVCWACTFTKAREQGWRHHTFSAGATTVELDTGIPLGDLHIRCTVCLKPTTYLEKLAVVSRGGRFHKIGHHWRGFCTACIDLRPEDVGTPV